MMRMDRKISKTPSPRAVGLNNKKIKEWQFSQRRFNQKQKNLPNLFHIKVKAIGSVNIGQVYPTVVVVVDLKLVVVTSP